VRWTNGKIKRTYKQIMLLV